MSTKNPVGFFVISMKGEERRWTTISRSAQSAGVELVRIDAVDGRNVPEEKWDDFDIGKFRRAHGQHPKPGEFGCYMSHLKALTAFLDSEFTSAVILEDDAILNGNSAAFCDELDRRYGSSSCLVRLTSHRQPLFEALDKPYTGISIGQCWFGPTGSAAAWWCTRSAAKKLLKSMTPGYLPFDIMLERPWETGIPAFMVRPDVIDRDTGAPSVIKKTGTRHRYKFPFYRRTGALGFRVQQLFSRLFWCTRTRRMPGTV